MSRAGGQRELEAKAFAEYQKERECLTAVLDGHEDEAKPEAYQDYADCLANNESCVEGWYDDCTADH